MPHNKTNDDLTLRCREYLLKGPPGHMADYVPESLTEIIIAHGAQSLPLDCELKAIGAIVVMESENLDRYSDPEIRNYMRQGVKLVEEVLARNA